MNRNFTATNVQTTSFPAEKNRFSIDEIVRVFLRRKGIFLATIFLLTGIALLTVLQLPKEYTAVATIEVEPTTNNVLDPQAIFSGLPMDTETILTEIEILKARALHQQVVEELGLVEDPEFNGALSPGLLSSILSFGGSEELLEQKAAREFAQTISALSDKISIEAIGLSRTINVAVRSEDPAKAAVIANTLTDKYLNSQLEAKFDEIQRTSNWLNERLSDLEAKVQISEQAVEEYRQRNDLLTVDAGSSATTEQISNLNTEIILARSDRAQAEAKLTNIQNLLQRPEGINSAGDVLDNQFIQSLKNQESEVLRNIANMQERYGPKHPLMIQAQSELADIRNKVDVEVNKIVEGLKGDVDIARVREQTLIRELEKLEDRLGIINQKEIQLRQLQREADTNKTLYQDFLTSFKAITGQQGVQSTDARIISAAMAPTSPSHPKSMLILVAALVFAILAATALIFLIEILDNTYRSTETLEEAVGISALGIVPEISRKKGSKINANLAALKKKNSRKYMDRDFLKAISFYAHNEPTSSFAEAIRNINVGAALTNVDEPPKTILVTSSEPKEGKSTFALSMALVHASSDRKTVVVDCDLRKPFIHEMLGVGRGPGVVDFLKGDVKLKDIIHKNKETGAYYITAGQATNQSANLLESAKFNSFLADLQKQFDQVIIDSPPIMAITDSNILAQKVDGVVFVARWGWTRQNIVKESLKRLQKDKANILGVVLTRVNLARQAKYGYGDSNYYYSGYSDYYTKSSQPG